MILIFYTLVKPQWQLHKVVVKTRDNSSAACVALGSPLCRCYLSTQYGVKKAGCFNNRSISALFDVKLIVLDNHHLRG